MTDGEKMRNGSCYRSYLKVIHFVISTVPFISFTCPRCFMITFQGVKKNKQLEKLLWGKKCSLS